VFENEMLSRIFRPMREEVSEEWRKLCKKMLHNKYSSCNVIGVIKSRHQYGLDMHHIGKIRIAHKILFRKSEENNFYGKSKHRREIILKKAPKGILYQSANKSGNEIHDEIHHHHWQNGPL
jgi:hypothetical protein